MEVKVCSLSGEPVATLRAHASDTVADLKMKLDQSAYNRSHYDVQLLVDGTRLQDTSRLSELLLTPASQLHVIRSRKSAREILFGSPECALELAEHYDSMQEECAEHIGTLFVDQHGDARSPTATIEVLLALQGKLSQVKAPKGPKRSSGQPGESARNCDGVHPKLTWLKAALARVAMDMLQSHTPPLRHKDMLVAGFVWFGAPAVCILLEKLQHSSIGVTHERVRDLLQVGFAAFSKNALKELLSEACSASLAGPSPRAELRAILQKALIQAKQLTKPSLPPARPSLPRHSPQERDKDPSLKTSQEVLAAMRRGQCEVREEICGDVQLNSFGCKPCKVSRSVLLAACEKEPHTVVPFLQGSLVLAAMENCRGAYQHLPEPLKNDRTLLYAALSCDRSVQAEFVRTAGKCEIQKWRWHLSESHRQLSKLR